MNMANAPEAPISLPRRRILTDDVTDAEADAVDLIVMSTHAYTGPPRALLGSVADAVVRHSACPVLLVHRARPGTPTVD